MNDKVIIKQAVRAVEPSQHVMCSVLVWSRRQHVFVVNKWLVYQESMCAMQIVLYGFVCRQVDFVLKYV